jgi:hypothetical protein
MVVFQTAKLRRGVRMFRATRSTADSRQIITILTTSSVFRAADQPPTRSALLTPNWRGCEGVEPADAMHQIDVGDRDRRISNPLTPGIQQCAASRADGPAQSGTSTSGCRAYVGPDGEMASPRSASC